MQVSLNVKSSDRDKRKRLTDSVKGPALEIVKAARLSTPDASALDCIEVLERRAEEG